MSISDSNSIDSSFERTIPQMQSLTPSSSANNESNVEETSLAQQLVEWRANQATLIQIFEDTMKELAKYMGESKYEDWRRSEWQISRNIALQPKRSNIVSAESSQPPKEQISVGQQQKLCMSRVLVQYLKSREEVSFNIRSLWRQIHSPSEEVIAMETFLSQTPKTLLEKNTSNSIVKNFRQQDSIIGTILWEMAKIFSVETFFVPTCQCKDESSERTIYLEPTGEWISLALEKEDLPQKSLCTAMMLSLIFGMRARVLNVFFSEGSVIFAPNILIMPHSNGVIQRNKEFFPAFHSCLLSLAGCYEPLTSEEKEHMDQFLSMFTEEGCEELQDLLDSYEPAFDDKLRFNPKQMMEAFKERLILLKKALAPDNDQISTLRDLVFAVYPDLKFFVAVGIDQRVARETTQSSADAHVSLNEGNQQDLKKFQRSYFDSAAIPGNSMLEGRQCIELQTISNWCKDSSLSFDTIVERIINSAENSRVLTSEELEENQFFLCKRFMKLAIPDFKGIKNYYPDWVIAYPSS